jgi:hypothetical protein
VANVVRIQGAGDWKLSGGTQVRFFFSLAIVMMVALPAAAQPWYARGEFNGWTTDNQMVDQGGGHYTATISGLFANTDFEYKLAEEDYDPAAPGSNGKVRSNAAGEINFHLYDSTTWDDGWFPNDTRRVGYEDHDLFDWEIVGSFNDWPATNDPMYSLTDMGNGLHTGQFAFDAGTYQFKFRQQDPTNPWNTSIGNDFGNSAGNNFFTVTTDGDLSNSTCRMVDGGPIPRQNHPRSRVTTTATDTSMQATTSLGVRAQGTTVANKATTSGGPTSASFPRRSGMLAAISTVSTWTIKWLIKAADTTPPLLPA